MNTELLFSPSFINLKTYFNQFEDTFKYENIFNSFEDIFKCLILANFSFEYYAQCTSIYL